MSSKRFFEILCAGVFALLVTFSVECMGVEADEAPIPIRIGWQIPAVTQAAIVQVLKRTDVLARHGMEPNLIPFSYGTPEVEAALAGKLDAFFAGDQPTINLLANGGKWKIVARLYYDRVAVIVPPNSPIQSIKDLKGKTIASPFGSIAHREAFLEQQAAGLDANKDVRNENMDILEIRRRVLGGGVESWEGIDAAAVWEPNASSFQLAGHTRHLAESRAMHVVAISDDFVSKHPEAAVHFLVALVQAWDYFSRNSRNVMEWYNDDIQLGYSPESLITAVKIEPNFGVKSLHDIDLELNEELIGILEQNAAWGVEAWDDGSQIRQYIDQDLLARAKQEIAAVHYEDIQVILPSIRAVDSTRTEVGFNLDAIPLAVVFAFMVVIALLAIETGFWFGKRGQKKLENDPVRPIATVVGAVLGMMAFVIALTFGSASNRFDARKTALLDDVTAIQTAYLRADLLPEPHRTTVRSLLRDYVQVRAGIVYAYGQPDTLQLVQRRAEALQESMWSHVEDLAEADGDTKIYVFFASTLNDVFNLHTKRVVLGAHYRIPDFVWWALIFASSVAMVAVGFQFGVEGGRRIHTANFSLAITFALVMLLAFDLDRAGEGLVAVNQQPMIDLFRTLSTRR